MSKAGRICEQTGKHIHASRGEAIAHQRRLHEWKEYPVDPFYCEFCGAWHVGRLKAKAHKNKFRK